MPRTNFRSARKLLSPTTLHIHVVRSCRFTLRHAFAFVLRIEYLYLLGNYLCHFPFSMFINFSRTLFPLLWIFDYFLPTNASQIHSHRKFAFRKKFPKRDESSFQTKREIIPDGKSSRMISLFVWNAATASLLHMWTWFLSNAPPSPPPPPPLQNVHNFDDISMNITTLKVPWYMFCCPVFHKFFNLCLLIRNLFSSRFLGLGLVV